MARYINADVFANSLRQFCKDAHWGNAEQRFSLDQIISALERQPTADVVKVLRCKDCIRLGFCGDETNLEIMGFYGFCSRAKSRASCNASNTLNALDGCIDYI